MAERPGPRWRRTRASSPSANAWHSFGRPQRGHERLLRMQLRFPEARHGHVDQPEQRGGEGDRHEKTDSIAGGTAQPAEAAHHREHENMAEVDRITEVAQPPVELARSG